MTSILVFVTTILVATCPILYCSAAAVAVAEDFPYFKTQNSAAWAENQGDCDVFDSTLLEINSINELATLKRYFLSSGDTGKSYYTGGMYDTAANRFVWKSGRVLDERFFPWAAGHPTTKNGGTRVIVVVGSGNDVEFKTVFQTDSYRGLCERP